MTNIAGIEPAGNQLLTSQKQFAKLISPAGAARIPHHCDRRAVAVRGSPAGVTGHGAWHAQQRAHCPRFRASI